MMNLIKPNGAPVPPVLVASVLDQLAKLPIETRLEAGHVIGIARGIGCNAIETGALVVRIRAAAIELDDPRWRPWAAYFRRAPPDARCRFDALVLRIIAGLPLIAARPAAERPSQDAAQPSQGASLRFPPGLFFRTLLAGVVPDSVDTFPQSAAPTSP